MLKGILASVKKKRREQKLWLKCGKPDYLWGVYDG
jgi:hypothetical protein